jgi:hypothetical protein
MKDEVWRDERGKKKTPEFTHSPHRSTFLTTNIRLIFDLAHRGCWYVNAGEEDLCDCDIISLLVGLMRRLLIFGVLLVRHEVKKKI